MARMKPANVALIGCGLVVLAFTRPCGAHFLWLKAITHEDKPQAFLFFGETAMDEAYHLPEALADAKVWRRNPDGKRNELPIKGLESDDRIGLVGPLEHDKPCVLEASERYGVYGTALLVYSAKHVRADSRAQFNAAGASQELPLDIVPRVEGDSLALTVLWEGKPLAGAEVSIAVGDAQVVEKKSDEEGRVTFMPESDGLVSVLASRMDEDLTGELNGKKYDHGLHYASLTFEWPISAKADEDKSLSAKPPLGRVFDPEAQTRRELGAERRAAVPPLPEPLSSFGAVVADGWLYVYGGHTGTEHEHSAANLSNHFRRVRLDGSASTNDSGQGIGAASATLVSEWEELPMQTPLQGLALVAHNGKIFRIGGMNARNETIDEEENLHSTAEFAEFDPETGRWTALAPLPSQRSSHNAVVIGDRLYVVGGWALSGSSPGEWQEDALAYDFSDPHAGWQELPKPPFTRRALAVSHWHSNLVAIGGLDDEGQVSQRVDLFDPETGDWTEGPELPGDGPSGFGMSAWNLEGRLYVSGIRGVLLRLSDDGSRWQQVGQPEKPRLFHQLVPAPGGGLLAVGGASRDGHLADIEWIDVRK